MSQYMWAWIPASVLGFIRRYCRALRALALGMQGMCYVRKVFHELWHDMFSYLDE